MKLTMRLIRKYHGCNSIHVVRQFARLNDLDMGELLQGGWDIEQLKGIDDAILKNILDKMEAENGQE